MGGSGAGYRWRIQQAAHYILNDTIVTSLGWKRTSYITEVKGDITSIWWFCFAAQADECILVGWEIWGKIHLVTRMIARCVGLNGVLLFLSNLNSNEPDPRVSTSLSLFIHSLFLSQCEQELWLWALFNCSQSLAQGRWAEGWCDRTACVCVYVCERPAVCADILPKQKQMLWMLFKSWLTFLSSFSTHKC